MRPDVQHQSLLDRFKYKRVHGTRKVELHVHVASNGWIRVRLDKVILVSCTPTDLFYCKISLRTRRMEQWQNIASSGHQGTTYRIAGHALLQVGGK